MLRYVCKKDSKPERSKEGQVINVQVIDKIIGDRVVNKILMEEVIKRLLEVIRDVIIGRTIDSEMKNLEIILIGPNDLWRQGLKFRVGDLIHDISQNTTIYFYRTICEDCPNEWSERSFKDKQCVQ